MTVQIAYKLRAKILWLGLVIWIAACAAPPTTPLPVEVGRARSGDTAAPIKTDTDDTADTSVLSVPAGDIETGDIKTNNVDLSSATEVLSGKSDDVALQTAAKTSQTIVVEETNSQAKAIPSPDSEVAQAASDISEQTMPAADEQPTKLESDIAALVDARSDAQTSDMSSLAAPSSASDIGVLDDGADITQGTGVLSSDKLLGKEALDAAFSLLASRAVKNVETTDLVPPRVEGEFRVGVMLPFTGPYAALGADIANGAELALFQLKLPFLNLIYIDTGAGDRALDAVAIARDADLDLIIGPLFSDSIEIVQPLLSELAIPALTLTNNRDMARPNSWVLGYIPEQQIDLLLSQSIEAGNTKIAILASDDLFGQRIVQHSMTRMRDFGLQPADLMILGADRLDEETNLREAIKQFARYQKSDEDDSTLLPPAPYDSLILAGLPSFLLRVAPVLDYYDLGPDRVDYLGTDLWNRPDLLTEPSLQDSYISIPQQPDDTAFRTLWSQVFEFEPSNFAKLGFDVLAVAGALHPYIDSPEAWPKYLARKQGFSGFTGSFRLLPDGTNTRQFQVKQLVDYELQDSHIDR